MTLLRATCAATALCLSTAPAVLAASADDLDLLFQAIGTPRLMEIMRAEGMDQAGELGTDMFGRRGAEFRDMAGRIYDTGRMTETFRVEFDAALVDVDVAPLLAFFASDRGREIVSLELSAREALIDPDIEEAAETAAEQLAEDSPDRRDLLETFVNTNDLVNLNVMGAMNASVAYYQGLVSAGDGALSEGEILSEVWSQEPEIRADTEVWIYAYLGFAYDPLEDADIEAYIDMSSSPAGKALNRALFEGFDDVFNEVSYLLGRATVTFGQSEEL